MTAWIRGAAGALALLACSSCISISLNGEDGWGASYDHTAAPVTRALAIASGAGVTIDASTGSLDVRRALGPEVVVTATAAAVSEERLARTGFELWAGDGGVNVHADVPEGGKLDLVVEVPAGHAVTIRDGSGSTSVSDVASLVVIDGSGGLTIRGVDGDVSIDDGSGSIRVSDVGGSVSITDGSGSIDVHRVFGDVIVGDDGSGSISVRDVGGDFRVISDGSGSVSHDGVAGEIWIDD